MTEAKATPIVFEPISETTISAPAKIYNDHGPLYFSEMLYRGKTATDDGTEYTFEADRILPVGLRITVTDPRGGNRRTLVLDERKLIDNAVDAAIAGEAPTDDDDRAVLSRRVEELEIRDRHDKYAPVFSTDDMRRALGTTDV
jgi:hypothetical protein